MDSRIIESKKARKTIGRIIEKRIKHNGSPKSCDACKADMALSRIDEALALLTDKTETCGDAAPAIDPISGMHFFMMIKHPDKGWVPTYGGPYDSYTLCERDDDGIETDVVGFTRERYDHDEGGWVEGGEILDCALVNLHKASQVADKRSEDLREENERLKKRVADLENEVATPILVNTARLADQLATERDRVDELRSALEKIKSKLLHVELPSKYKDEDAKRLDTAATDCYEIADESLAILSDYKESEKVEVTVGSKWNYDRSLDMATWKPPLIIKAIVDGITEKAVIFDQPMPYKSYGVSYFGIGQDFPFTPYKEV